MKILVFSLLMLVAPLAVYSQKPPVKFGKLSEEEIKLSAYENADAVILCDYGKLYFSGKTGYLFLYRYRHLRIKILTEEGLKHVQQSIPFYDLIAGSNYPSNRVYELKAQTLNINRDGKIVKTRLKPKNEEVGKADAAYNNTLKINFPDVRVGSIIEYEINIPTIDIVNPDVWYYQHTIPVIHSELRIICPDNVNYRAKSYNTDYLEIAETTYESTLIAYRANSLTFQGYQIRLVKKNIPAAAKDIPDRERIHQKVMLDYVSQEQKIPGIEVLFKATDPDYKFKDRASKLSTISPVSYILYKKPDLTSLPKKKMKDHAFGPPLDLPSNIGDTIKILTANCHDKNEELAIIYNYISQHMTWNGEYRTSVSPSFSKLIHKIMALTNYTNLNTSLSKPFKKQEGTNAEINFILINALRRAGFNANPVLTGIDNCSNLDPDFFNLHEFNHVVALVEVDGKEILLDAVQNENGISKLNNKEISPKGLVIKNDEAFWITIH